MFCEKLIARHATGSSVKAYERLHDIILLTVSNGRSERAFLCSLLTWVLLRKVCVSAYEGTFVCVVTGQGSRQDDNINWQVTVLRQEQGIQGRRQTENISLVQTSSIPLNTACYDRLLYKYIKKQGTANIGPIGDGSCNVAFPDLISCTDDVNRTVDGLGGLWPVFEFTGREQHPAASASVYSGASLEDPSPQPKAHTPGNLQQLIYLH